MKKDELIIRDAILSDVDRIVELYKQLYEAEYPYEHETSNNLKKPSDYFSDKGFKKVITNIKKSIKDNKIKFVVCAQNDIIIGYASAHIINRPVYKIKVLFGDEIVIDKDYRRQGISNLLINEIIKWGKRKKAKQIMITVWGNNIPSMNKHIKLGFKPRHVCLYKDI